MMSRVREALFSMLYPTGVLRDSASALDLFAGAGTVGIECLSRGVGTAVHVDFSPKCTETIRENLEALGLNERGRAVQASVFDVLLKPESFGLTEPFDLVTMTPPYEEVVYADLMDALVASPLLVEDTVLVIEVRAQPRPWGGTRVQPHACPPRCSAPLCVRCRSILSSLVCCRLSSATAASLASATGSTGAPCSASTCAARAASSTSRPTPRSS